MERQGFTKNKIISELTRSPHGDLKQYVPVGSQAAREEAEFFAHLISWNRQHGQVRDSQVALPIIALAGNGAHPEFTENALAHLALLDPRNLVRGLRFGKELKTPNHGRALRSLVERYLRIREDAWPWWERTALAHRASLKTLYAMYHVKPNAAADLALFKGQPAAGSLLDVIRNLKNLPATEAAGIIIKRRIPFLAAQGALGARAKEPEMVLALIENMSPTELVTNTASLERLGMKANPALRAAYEVGIQKLGKSKKTSMKASRAIESLKDESLKEKLRGAQEKQIKALGGVDGNWLVLGDKSSSMSMAIEVSRRVAATLAKLVNGEVHLVFFDSTPRHVAATGKDYDALLAETRHVDASGNTSIGCGLRWILDKGIEVDGIAIVSDGGENTTPLFAETYQHYAQMIGKEPVVYLYETRGDPNSLAPAMRAHGLDLQTFDLRHGAVDFYSLPNLVQTMNTRRYGLVEQIMDTPLLTLDEAFKPRAAEAV